MKIRISDFSNIFLGALKTRLHTKEKSEYEYKIVESKDFNDNEIAKIENLTTIFLEEPIQQSYLLKEGDIIIKLFTPYSIFVVTKEYANNCIVLSNIAVIRQEQYPSYYLREMIAKVWKKTINKIPKGSLVRTTSISEIQKIEINIEDNNEEILIKDQIINETLKINKLLEQKKELNIKKMKKIIGDRYE